MSEQPADDIVSLTFEEYQARKAAGTAPKYPRFIDSPRPATPPATASPSALPSTSGGRGKSRGRGKGRTRSERFATVNTFIDFGVATAKLTPIQALVWVALWRDTKASGTARTSQADIARRLGRDERTVRRAVAALVKRGFVSVVQRGKLNVGPSVYRVHPTGPQEDTHALLS
ncbi:helix-turn-helix domain-containing protein [Mycobacterium sp.]|uniref:helix-turn-helix domain-containing protein n=1 Tax=Mycobacterium sp. TaxID=1785 RepID=UPI003A8561BD